MENWKDIQGFEGLYQISSLGRVKGIATGFKRKPGFVKDHDNTKGYRYVTLYGNGVKKNKYIHRLMAQAFLDNPDNLPQVNHKDTNKANNTLSNLEWCNESGNMIHAYENGLVPVGEKSHLSKVTEKEVREIRRLFADGITRKSLSRAYMVSLPQIHRIIHRQLWKQVC